MISKKYFYIRLMAIMYSIPLILFAITSITHVAHAGVSGDCWFPAGGPVNEGGNCTVQGSTSYGDYGTNDLLPGRTGAGDDIAIPLSVTTGPDRKQKFINFIVDYYNSGGDHKKVGAAFIMQYMREGKPHNFPSAAERDDWVNLMSQSNVSVERESITVGRTTYYDNNKDNAFIGDHVAVTRVVLAIKQDGVSLGYIETGCGNMVPGFNHIKRQSATITLGSSISAATVYTGDNVTFRQTATTSDLDRVGNDKFTYNVNGQSATSGTKNLSPAGQKVSPNSLVTTSFPSANKYCRGIIVTAKPGYAVVNGDGGERCVNVIQKGQYTIGLTGVENYEKGSGDRTVTGTLSANPLPCDKSKPNGTIVSTVSWQLTANGITQSQTSGIPNCSGAISNASLSNTIAQATLDSMNPGAPVNYSYQATGITGIPSKGPLPPFTDNSFRVYEVPYTTFKGHDIYAAGSGSGNLPAPNNSIPSGSIFFNSASGNRGSRDQYASIANHATNVITTAVERLIAPIPISASSTGGLSARWPTGKAPSSAWSTITTNGSLPQTVTGTTSTLPATSGYYTATTPTISGTGIPNTGRKITVKSSGNITINDNIQLSSIPTAYNKDNSVILLISDGDINISPNVTRIDAILIAKGKINTCSGPSRANWHQASPAGCRNPLVVNGAMGASFINFGRSIGTRYLNNGAAEEIKYPEYLNFATPYLRDYSTNSSNAIFNAPPLL